MQNPFFNKPLLVSGAILFLLGLIQGAIVDQFANPRMALSAHLTAVQCAMAIMIAGIIWPVIDLPPLLEKLSLWAIPVSMYALWLGLSLSAATGASEALPIAGAGYHASAQIEAVVTILVMGSSGLMVIGWALLVLGLLRGKFG